VEELVDRAGQRPERSGTRVGQSLHAADVLPGGEGPPGAGDDQGPDIRCCGDLRQQLPEAVPHLLVPCVESFRPVESQDADVAGKVGQQHGVGDRHHTVSSIVTTTVPSSLVTSSPPPSPAGPSVRRSPGKTGARNRDRKAFGSSPWAMRASTTKLSVSGPWAITDGIPAAWAKASSTCMGLKSPLAPAYRAILTRSTGARSAAASSVMSRAFR